LGRRLKSKELAFWENPFSKVSRRLILPNTTYTFKCRCRFDKVFIALGSKWRDSWKVHNHFFTTDDHGLVKKCGIAKLRRNGETGMYTKEAYWEADYVDLFSFGIPFVRDIQTKAPKKD